MGFLGTLRYVLIYTSVARIATLTMQEKVGGVSGQGPEEGIPCPSTSLLEFFGIRDCSSFHYLFLNLYKSLIFSSQLSIINL